jgi:GTP cyclohydrolase I
MTRRMSHEPAVDRVQQPPPLATFPNDDGYDQLVLALAIPFQGLCEHHAMPVAGTAHIGYRPAGLMLGGATLGRLIEFFAAWPQSQADLTHQIAEHLAVQLSPHGVGVMMEAGHSCIAPNNVHAVGPISITSALLGTLRTDPSYRREFFSLIRMSR